MSATAMTPPAGPITEIGETELLAAREEAFDTERLRFPGLRGDPRRHLGHAALRDGLARLAPPPRDVGTVDLMVARGDAGERDLPSEALLTVDGGMPGDRWGRQHRYGPPYQLATTRTDIARLIANGQPLELHGDNLFLHLDLSRSNLPAGTRLRLGEAVVQVTPQAHNGCKKWVQRFGLAPMQLHLDPERRHLRLRGLYLQVVEEGMVRVGDLVSVLERPAV